VSAAAASVTRNPTVDATSPGTSVRGSACRDRTSSKAAPELPARAADVSVSPGATQVTAIPSAPSPTASVLASPVSVPLLDT
jgi:hypothetical protein